MKMKLMVVKYDKGKEEKFVRHSKMNIKSMYVVAVIDIINCIVLMCNRNMVGALSFLFLSFVLFMLGRNWERENLLLEIIEDVVKETNDKIVEDDKSDIT